jgi:1-acyl-sn-glycerol-3-phosphate acyltransferase
MSEPVGRFTSPGLKAARYVAQRGLLKTLVWRLVRVAVQGADRLKGLEGPFIVVANHSSHLDAPLIFGSLPWRHAKHLAAGAAADYFFDVPWRTWLTVLFFNAYPVDRAGGRNRPRLSKSLLEAGVSLLLFPEGGRAKRDQGIRTFKPGAAALSISADVPVLPIGLVGAQQAMPRGTSWPKRGRMPVTVVIGEPLRAAEGESVEDFTRRLQQEVVRLSTREDAG